MAKSFNANTESQYSMLPMTREERAYNFADNTWVNIGLTIATWCFMIGGSLSLFVGFWPSFWATLTGNAVAILIMIMTTAVPSAKYGTDNYVNNVSWLGRNGKTLLMTMITCFQVCWVVVLCVMFGRAVSNVLSAATGDAMGNGFTIAMTLVGAFLVWLVVWKGPVVLKRLNRIVGPMLVLVLFVMLFLLLKNVGWGPITSAEPLAAFDSEWVNFLIAFELNLGAGLSWLPNIGGMARICKTTRAAYWPNLIGLCLTATLGTQIGLATALTIGSTDPTEWMVPMAGLVFGIISLLFIATANVSSASIVVYNLMLGFKTLKIFRKISWCSTVLVFMVPVVIGLLLFPSQIYDNFYIVLGVTCTFYAPVCGMSFVDYYVFRKQHLDVSSLYNATETSAYNFWGGFNWVAVVTLFVSMGFYMLFLNPATLVYQPAFVYCTATIVTVLFSGLMYFVLTKLFCKKVGSYGWQK